MIEVHGLAFRLGAVGVDQHDFRGQSARAARHRQRSHPRCRHPQRRRAPDAPGSPHRFSAHLSYPANTCRPSNIRRAGSRSASRRFFGIVPLLTLGTFQISAPGGSLAIVVFGDGEGRPATAGDDKHLERLIFALGHSSQLSSYRINGFPAAPQHNRAPFSTVRDPPWNEMPHVEQPSPGSSDGPPELPLPLCLPPSDRAKG